MNGEDIQVLINACAEKQKHVWCLCPRCGGDRMRKDLATNAMSRHADIMICDTCGTVEALGDHVGMPVELEKWALIEHPERFFLKGKDYREFYFTFGSWSGFPFKNAYVVVQGADRPDAVARFRRHFPDKTKGVACYSFDYDATAWEATDCRKHLPCAGRLKLNGVFEEAE